MPNHRLFSLASAIAYGFLALLAFFTIVEGHESLYAAPNSQRLLVPEDTCTVPGTHGDITGALADVNCDQINVASGQFSGIYTVTHDVTLSGAGAQATILDGQDAGAVFRVLAGTSFTLTDVTVQNGYNTDDGGGGIRNAGLLLVARSVLSSNVGMGGGIYSDGGSAVVLASQFVQNNGAGIWSDNGAVVTVTDSLFDENQHAGLYSDGAATHVYSTTIRGTNGSGISHEGGDLTVLDSSIFENAADSGAGLALDSRVTGETVLIARSAITGNMATSYDGGGLLIWTTDSVITITESTIAENSAAIDGGAISSAGSVTIINSTISHNTAMAHGGAISNRGYLELLNATVYSNTADDGGGLYHYSGTTVSDNSIVGDNAGGDCGLDSGGSGLINIDSYNLDTDNSCAAATTVSNLLLAPHEEGDRMPIHALRPGSPAIDAGDDLLCPAFDQRGVSRPLDGDEDGTPHCDVGAYELDPASIADIHNYLPIILK